MPPAPRLNQHLQRGKAEYSSATGPCPTAKPAQAATGPCQREPRSPLPSGATRSDPARQARPPRGERCTAPSSARSALAPLRDQPARRPSRALAPPGPPSGPPSGPLASSPAVRFVAGCGGSVPGRRGCRHDGASPAGGSLWLAARAWRAGPRQAPVAQPPPQWRPRWRRRRRLRWRRPQRQRGARRPPGRGDAVRVGAGLLQERTEQGRARILRHPVRQAPRRPAPLQEARAHGALAGCAARQHPAQQLLPGALRVLPGLRGRGDVEPQHQRVRGLPLPQHLGPPARAAAAPRGRAAAGAGAGVDLRRLLHERHLHAGRVQRGHGGGHQRRHRGLHAVPRGRLRLPVPAAGRAARRRGRGGQHGAVGPGARHPLDQGEHRGLRRRPRPHHAVRRERRRRIGEPAPAVAGDAGAGAARHPAVGHAERALVLHDGREGGRGGAQAHRRRGLQRHQAAGRPAQGDVVHAAGGGQDPVHHAVELVLGHPRIPLGAHHRRRLPAQAPAGPAARGRVRPGHRDHDRFQPGRRHLLHTVRLHGVLRQGHVQLLGPRQVHRDRQHHLQEHEPAGEGGHHIPVHGLGEHVRRLPEPEDDRRGGGRLLLHLPHQQVRQHVRGSRHECVLLLLYAAHQHQPVGRLDGRHPRLRDRVRVRAAAQHEPHVQRPGARPQPAHHPGLLAVRAHRQTRDGRRVLADVLARQAGVLHLQRGDERRGQGAARQGLRLLERLPAAAKEHLGVHGLRRRPDALGQLDFGAERRRAAAGGAALGAGPAAAGAGAAAALRWATC